MLDNIELCDWARVWTLVVGQGRKLGNNIKVLHIGKEAISSWWLSKAFSWHNLHDET
jgi:hypothetical protein